MQSVTFKINYSYTIIKMVSFVLTKCFKSSLYQNRYNVLKAYKFTMSILDLVHCCAVHPGGQSHKDKSASIIGFCVPSLSISQ